LFGLARPALDEILFSNVNPRLPWVLPFLRLVDQLVDQRTVPSSSRRIHKCWR
jgi:hypothetical protein